MTQNQELMLETCKKAGVEQTSFYGVLASHLQNGQLTLIRVEQTTLRGPAFDLVRCFCHQVQSSIVGRIGIKGIGGHRLQPNLASIILKIEIGGKRFGKNELRTSHHQ